VDIAELQRGLIVVTTGMGLVFLALGLLMVAMWALDRAFRPVPAASPEPTEGPTPAELAAIAAAVLHLRAEGTRRQRIGGESLGAGLGSPPGHWWRSADGGEG